MSFLNGTDPGLRQTRTPTVDTFAAGVGFTAGSSTYVTLSVDCGTEASLITTFDGITQHRDTYSYDTSNRRVTFDAAIPTGVSKIECTYTTTIPATTPADGSVGTAQLADNGVTGGKIALGSDAQGDIMYYNGTDYVRLAKGSALQQLRINSGATAPEWATVSGGATVALDTVTASGAGSVSSPTFDSTYKTIMVIGSNIIPSNNDTGIHLYYSDDALSSVKSSSYRWAAHTGKSDGSEAHAGSQSDSVISMLKTGGDEGMENSAAQGASFTLWLDSPATTDNYKTCRWIMSCFNTESTPRHLAITGGGQWFGGTGAINAIRFNPSGGTISGVFEFYGIKGA